MRSSPPIRRSHSVGCKTDPMLVLLVAFSLVFSRKIVERLLLLRLDLLQPMYGVITCLTLCHRITSQTTRSLQPMYGVITCLILCQRIVSQTTRSPLASPTYRNSPSSSFRLIHLHLFLLLFKYRVTRWISP